MLENVMNNLRSKNIKYVVISWELAKKVFNHN